MAAITASKTRPNRPARKEAAPATTPSALKNFDDLPDSANVRLPVVIALFACSATSVWRNVKKGLIPKPRKLTNNITAWNVGELREALGANEGGQNGH